LTVGQTLGVQPPLDQRTWQLDYNHDALRLLTPANEETKPGARGWVWKTAQAGDFEIQLTSDAPCGTPPCPPNVARYTFSVSIKPGK